MSYLVSVSVQPMLGNALVAFSIGALRWRMRVEAYLLLMVDAHPPFSLE